MDLNDDLAVTATDGVVSRMMTNPKCAEEHLLLDFALTRALPDRVNAVTGLIGMVAREILQNRDNGESAA